MYKFIMCFLVPSMYEISSVHFRRTQLTKELMNGHSDVGIPGGFGAAGAPNDGWHQCVLLKSLCDCFVFN